MNPFITTAAVGLALSLFLSAPMLQAQETEAPSAAAESAAVAPAETENTVDTAPDCVASDATEDEGIRAEDGESPKEKPCPVYTIVQAGTLLAVPGEAPLTQVSVIIEDDVIVDVVDGYRDTVEEASSGVTVLNLQDKFVMPGLFDVHVHLRGREGDVAQKAFAQAANAKKTVEAGFTSIREIGTNDWSLLDLKKKIDKGDLLGPRIVYAGKIVGVGPDRCNGPESCRSMTRENIQNGAEWIKIYSSCSGFYTCSEEDYPSVFFDDEIKAIVETAKKYRIPIAAHSHPRASAHYSLDYGVKSIEHGTFLDDKALRRMKKDDVFYVPTIAVQDFLEESKKKGTFDEEKQEHMDLMMGDAIVGTVTRAHAAGVKIATGSDAGVVPNGKNYRELERLAAIESISNAEVLKMATVNSAELLGQLDELGTLEKDKLADLIAIDGNPLETMKDIRKVKLVMIGGKVVVNRP